MNYPLLNIRVNEELCSEIIKFCESNQEVFSQNTVSLGRKCCNFNKNKSPLCRPLGDKIKQFSKECYALLGITEYEEEPMFGNFIGVNSKGAFVHLHKDPTGSGGKCHVRLNFIIQKPDSGGNPVIENKEYDIEQGYGWINLASKWYHKSTPVVGSKERITLSLGALVEDNEIIRNINARIIE